jgi:hypothetical protein
MPQCQRAMRTQILHIENFEPAAGNLVQDPRDVRDLAAWKYETVDELTAGGPAAAAGRAGC